MDLPLKLASLGRRAANHGALYAILLPTILFYVIFSYIPMAGVTLAFKSFDYSKGMWDSPWVGWANFATVFGEAEFWNSVVNTLIIAAMRLVVEFPVPILLALLIHVIHVKVFKSAIQSILTFPHFISWIIVGGMMVNILGSAGVANGVLSLFGLPANRVLLDGDTFRWFLVVSNLWKEAGWGCIIYLAAISGINPEMYEAAALDGAGAWHKITKITLPAIGSTIVVMLVLFLSGVMSSGGGGFDQIFNTYNPSVIDKADIVDTYIFRRTFYSGESFETSTAVGLFKSVINFALVLGANYFTKKLGEEGVF